MVKQKKIFCCMLCALILVLFSLPENGNALIRFSIPHLEIPLDGQIVVPIDLVSNDPEGFLSWHFTIEYDPGILTFMAMTTDTQLMKNHSSINANEIDPPGNINIVGMVKYDSITGEDIPSKGTGTLVNLKFTAKRQYPVINISSQIIMSFKDSPGNSLRFAVCEPGSIRILPNLTISKVEPARGVFDQDVTITIYGQEGFNEGAIPVIGRVQGLNTEVSGNVITTQILARTLSPGFVYDVIVTNPNGDFGVLEAGYDLDECNGDVNDSGEVTPEDVLCAFESFLEMATSCNMGWEDVCCDVNRDDICTPADALCIFQKYLGLPNCLNGD